MKKLIIALTVSMLFAACSDSSETKVDVKNDSTTAAPQADPNMGNTQSMVTDSTTTDSSHLKPDAPK